jgi:hypothetical protein
MRFRVICRFAEEKSWTRCLTTSISGTWPHLHALPIPIKEPQIRLEQGNILRSEAGM